MPLLAPPPPPRNRVRALPARVGGGSVPRPLSCLSRRAGRGLRPLRARQGGSGPIRGATPARSGGPWALGARRPKLGAPRVCGPRRVAGASSWAALPPSGCCLALALLFGPPWAQRPAISPLSAPRPLRGCGAPAGPAGMAEAPRGPARRRILPRDSFGKFPRPLVGLAVPSRPAGRFSSLA